MTAVENAQAFCGIAKRVGGVVADEEKMQRQLRNERHGLKNREETLHARVISDQQQDEIGFAKPEQTARLFSACGAPGFTELAIVHTVWNQVNVAAVKVLREQIGGALRHRCERYFSIGIQPTLERRQQPVVGPAMQPSQNGGLLLFSGAPLTREFPEPLEHDMNDDDIRVEAIDAWRQNKVERKATESALPPPKKSIRRHPSDELHQVRSGNGRNLVPHNASRFAGSGRFAIDDRQILDALCVEMNLA